MTVAVDGRVERVLLVHNAYRQRGGEDAVVEAEQALLQSHGHEVRVYRRHNDDAVGAGALALAADTLWSRRTVRELDALVAPWRPDVVHVHNSFPLVSPSVYWAAARAGLPVVQTLHNFRLLCPQALLLRDGRVCEDCVGRVPWRAVAHRCYRGSATQSAAAASMLQLHRALGTWRDKVTLYIALNGFCRDTFVRGGLPAARLRVKPNFVDLPQPAARAREGLLFVGRLSEEKGVDVLLRAAARLPADTALRVVGDGPLADAVRSHASVQWLGALPPERLWDEMARARALLLPSIWYENHPRTLVEAFACGLPVIASRLGALADLVQHGQTGRLFEPGSDAALAAEIDWALAHADALAAMGHAARAHYEANWTPEANYRSLLSIYREAIAMTAGTPP